MCFGKESLVLEPEDDNDNDNKINDDVCLWFQLLELCSNHELVIIYRVGPTCIMMWTYLMLTKCEEFIRNGPGDTSTVV